MGSQQSQAPLVVPLGLVQDAAQASAAQCMMGLALQGLCMW